MEPIHNLKLVKLSFILNWNNLLLLFSFSRFRAINVQRQDMQKRRNHLEKMNSNTSGGTNNREYRERKKVNLRYQASLTQNLTPSPNLDSKLMKDNGKPQFRHISNSLQVKFYQNYLSLIPRRFGGDSTEIRTVYTRIINIACFHHYFELILNIWHVESDRSYSTFIFWNFILIPYKYIFDF